MGIPAGSITIALKNTRVVSTVLVLVVAVCAVLIGVGNLSRGWTVGVQIISVIAGAALGNFLRLDVSQHVVRNQARPATRHLFDRVTRLRVLVVNAEGYQIRVRELKQSSEPVDLERVGDWFGFLGEGMRAEIDATATAIQNWGDLATDVLDTEVQNYNSRNSRLPATQDGEQDVP